MLTDEELMEVEGLNNYNPKVLQEIIREFVVPTIDISLLKIRNTLTYYLATGNEKLGWVFPSYQIPIDDDVGKLFYTIVWQELYGTDDPAPINPDDYEEDCSPDFINSVYFSAALEKNIIQMTKGLPSPMLSLV